jgi:hypothetical protein
MKDFSNAEDFYRDTFTGDLSAELRERMVARMTRTRRITRIANVTKVAAATVAILLGALLLNRTARRPISVATQASAHTVVNLAEWKINTVRFANVVRTEPLAEDMVVRSAPTTVAIVHSDGPRGYEEISEDQMFRLLQGWTVALVRVNGVADLEILTQ